MLEDMDSTLAIIETFYAVVATVVMCTASVSLFLIYRSIIDNNREEIKILRAMGLSKNNLFWSFLIESLALVYSACFLGILLGLLISVSLSYEFALLLRVPFIYIGLPIELIVALSIVNPILVLIS